MTYLEIDTVLFTWAMLSIICLSIGLYNDNGKLISIGWVSIFIELFTCIFLYSVHLTNWQ
jgi:hypothetical protein